MSERTVLAISPHLDDAVLSAGALLAELVDSGYAVRVHTLFAGLPAAPLSSVAHAFHQVCGQDDGAVLQRRAEDVEAISVLGGTVEHSDFLDAIYRRVDDGGWLCPEERTMFDSDLPLEPPLAHALGVVVEGLLRRWRPGLVLTCSAIDGHVDHRHTREAVLGAVNGRRTRVLLWEDLPSAVGWPWPSGSWVQRFGSSRAWQRKLEAIARYRSQVRMLWSNGQDWRRLLREHAASRGAPGLAELYLAGGAT